MASPSYVLNEDILLKDSLSRIELMCNQVSKNLVKRTNIIPVMQRFVLRVVTYAKGALGDEYLTERSMTITGADDQIRTIALTSVTDTGRILDIHGLYEEDEAEIIAGDDGLYHRERNHDTFIKLRKNSELNARLRYYYFMGGKRQLKLWIGSDLGYSASSPSALLVYQREPWIGFTIADAEATDVYMDVPNIYIPYMETGAAMACLTEAGLKENQIPGTMRDQMAETVIGLDNFVQQKAKENEARMRDAS